VLFAEIAEILARVVVELERKVRPRKNSAFLITQNEETKTALELE